MRLNISSFPKGSLPRFRLINLIVALIIGLLICDSAHHSVMAQTEPVIEGTNIQPLTFGGNVSISSEAYGVNGIDSRRPPASALIRANTRFSIFGLRSGFNLRYSTENSKLRQSMNEVNFSAGWDWGSVSAGTVSPTFSRYSLSGTTVAGGLIELNPGNFRLQFTGGRAQRAVEPSTQQAFREPAFERWLWAGKAGFGERGGQHFQIGRAHV